MAIYIEDEETSSLINRYAELKNASKTGALRELLKREVSAMEQKNTADEKYRRIMEWLATLPAASEELIPKQHYDWLAGDPIPADLSPELRKELQIKDT